MHLAIIRCRHTQHRLVTVAAEKFARQMAHIAFFGRLLQRGTQLGADDRDMSAAQKQQPYTIGGILATADVETTAVGECVRCLIEVEQPVEVEIQEVFAYDEDEAFDYQVQDDHVDLEPVIRDAVVLSLPFQPVCQEDCPGLCPECGVRLLDNPGHEHEQPIDPRWAALAGLEGLTGDSTNDVIGERHSDDTDREKR